MSPAKRFLLIVFGVALAGWIALVWLLGPSGYSKEYLSGTFTFDGREMTRKVAHDHYLIIVKSLPYKLYAQRPHLHPPEPGPDPEKLMAGIQHLTEGEVDFVEAYESQEAFQREKFRQYWFKFGYRFFNMVLIFVLIGRFGKAPILNWLDAQVAAENATMDNAAGMRAEAEDRLQRAENSIANIPAARERIEAETRDRIARELEVLEEANQQSLAIARQEVEDRKRKEELAAALLVKKELVEQSIARVADHLRDEDSAARQAGWLTQFAAELERRAS